MVSGEVALMRAMVLRAWGGPLRMEEVPTPRPGRGEALIRVRACAPDQFDVTIRAGRAGGSLPLILGHEIAGEIAELGPEVSDLRVGDRIIVFVYLTCGACRFCLVGRETLCLAFRGYLGVHAPGGYAEYLVAPAQNLCRLPPEIPFPEATTLVSPIPTPLKALRDRGQVRPLEDVLIVGAAGGVGIHAVQIAKVLGARVLGVDLGEAKLAAVRDAGADAVIDGARGPFDAEVRRLTDGKGADVVVEYVGTAATLPASYRSLSRSGRMVIQAFQPRTVFACDPTRFVDDEIVVTGSRYINRRDMQDGVELVRRGQVRPIIQQTFPLEEAETVLGLLARNALTARAPLIP